MNIAAEIKIENASGKYVLNLEDLPRSGAHTGDQVEVKMVLIFQEGKGYVPIICRPAEQLPKAEAKTDGVPAISGRDNSAWIQKLEAYIEEHLEDCEMGVTALCRVARMSHTQLYRKLKARVQLTPSQFISSIRIKKGKNLLNQTDWNISEIAYEVGFNDPNYFSRMFRSIYGMSPKQFRQLSGKA